MTILFVTFPRSGHHLAITLLQDIAKEVGLPHSYCEFYTCCQSIPCKHGSFFLKNHDFALDPFFMENEFREDLPIDEDKKYIVLYRQDPLIQLEAWYRLFYAAHDYNLDDVVMFYKQHIYYYQQFMNKWARKSYPNVLKMEYDSLVEYPVVNITRMLDFVYGSTVSNTIPPALIHKVVNANNIKKTNGMSNLLYNTIHGAMAHNKEEYYIHYMVTDIIGKIIKRSYS